MEFVTDINRDEFEEFVWNHPKGHYMQSFKWAAVKPDWKWQGIIERNQDGKIIGSMAIITRKVPGLPYSLMYSPRGPVCDIHDRETFKKLTDAAKKLAKEQKCYVLRLDPDILISDEEFKNIALENNFKIVSESKSFESIQPRFVFRLNTEGKSEEQLMAEFHSKTRYNIRVAIKKGVEVKVCGKDKLHEFIPIMEKTGERDNFITRPIKYFENMADALGDSFRLYMAYSEGIPIAGAIAVLYGDKVWYLYGASANHHRNLMPNYLVQFEMIKWAVENKCSIYDFRGISGFVDESNPLYGIYRFKKGFNPDFTEFIGELDYVLNGMIYILVEKGQKFYRKVRRKIVVGRERLQSKRQEKKIS